MSKRSIQFLAAIVMVSATIAFSPRVIGEVPSGNDHSGHDCHADNSLHQEQNIENDLVIQLYGNHLCPVVRDYVDPRSFVEYTNEEATMSGRIYLCCDGCKARAEENLSDLYQRVYRTDTETGKAKEVRDLENSKCPVEGEVALADMTTEYNGMLVHFHSPECVGEFLKDPESGMVKILPKDKRFAYLPPARLRLAHR